MILIKELRKLGRYIDDTDNDISDDSFNDISKAEDKFIKEHCVVDKLSNVEIIFNLEVDNA